MSEQQRVPPEELEAQLRADLHEIRERVADEKFARELYRALADRAWHRADAYDVGHVVLSWKAAEELINELRAEVGRPPMVLAQTGGEGELDDDPERELGRLGWRSHPARTDQHDPGHLRSPEDPPRTPPDPEGRFARAHEEAERQRERKRPGAVGPT